MFPAVRFGFIRFRFGLFGFTSFFSVQVVLAGSFQSDVRFGSARLGSGWFNLIRFGWVRFGLIHFLLVRLVSIRFGSVRFGSLRCGSVLQAVVGTKSPYK